MKFWYSCIPNCTHYIHNTLYTLLEWWRERERDRIMGYWGRERSSEQVVTVTHYVDTFYTEKILLSNVSVPYFQLHNDYVCHLEKDCERQIKGKRKEERECQRVTKRVFTLKRRIAVIQQVLVCSTSAHRSLRSRAEHDLLGCTAEHMQTHTLVTFFIILQYQSHFMTSP